MDTSDLIPELCAPFNVTLPPENLMADDAPSQIQVLDAAILNRSSNKLKESFNLQVPTIKPLVYFQSIHDTRNKLTAIETLRKRYQVDVHGSKLVTSSTSPDLSWSVEQHYIDLFICVGAGLGFRPLIPLARNPNFEFTMQLKHPYRVFSAKFAKLGFDPANAMLWIGRSPSSEDVWIAWVPQGGLAIDCPIVEPGTSSGPTPLNTKNYKVTVMMMAHMLKVIGYGDITVDQSYPELSDGNDDFTYATNVL